jgi:hypothetical protein
MPTKSSKNDRLVALGTMIGLRHSVDLLVQQLIEEVIRVVRETQAKDLVRELERALGPQSVSITQQGEHFVAALPDGSILRSRRRRYVAQRIKEKGFLLTS